MGRERRRDPRHGRAIRAGLPRAATAGRPWRGHAAVTSAAEKLRRPAHNAFCAQWILHTMRSAQNAFCRPWRGWRRAPAHAPAAARARRRARRSRCSTTRQWRATSSRCARATGMSPPPPLPRTNRTSLVPPLVLSGHAVPARGRQAQPPSPPAVQTGRASLLCPVRTDARLSPMSAGTAPSPPAARAPACPRCVPYFTNRCGFWSRPNLYLAGQQRPPSLPQLPGKRRRRAGRCARRQLCV